MTSRITDSRHCGGGQGAASAARRGTLNQGDAMTDRIIDSRHCGGGQGAASAARRGTLNETTR
jgi:hypothetical protein